MDKKIKKNIVVMLTAILVLILLLVSDSFAQQGMKQAGSSDWGMATSYGRQYDPKCVEIIVGNVSSVENIIPMRGMSRGIHLIVQTDKETISVHLGPAEYIEKHDIKFKSSDKVEVKGSRIIFNEKPVILASEVKIGDKILKLRDENGVPVWSDWRRR